jgi:hypothetical protein
MGDRQSSDRRPGGGSPPRHAGDPFGEVLPATSRDEDAQGWGDPDDERRWDDHLRDEVPPHHG